MKKMPNDLINNSSTFVSKRGTKSVFDLQFILFAIVLAGAINVYFFFIWSADGVRDENTTPYLWTTVKNKRIWDINRIETINTSKLKCIQEKIFCRYDDIGDFLETIENPGLIHEPLPSIPSHRRIPHEKANNWSYVLEQRARLPEDGSMTALMDYNAMLLPLYKNVKSSFNSTTQNMLESDLDPILLDRITGRYHPYFTDKEVDKVKYLSISRTSNLHSCKPKFKFYFGTLAQGYLGLSLLDENLSRIEGTDVAIYVDKWLLGNETALFHDFQIFASRSSKENPLKDQLFLFASTHIGTYNLPIDIRRVPPSSHLSNYPIIPFDSKLNSTIVTPNSEYQYGDGFQVRFVDNPGRFHLLKHYRRPDKYYREKGIDRGKNFHIIETTNGQTYMELWPYKSSPNNSHVTVPINFYASSFNPSSEMKLFSHREFESAKKVRYQSVFHDKIESRTKLSQSFQTVTPKHERPKMKYRGTSQFIDMMLEGKDVKVGISHTVSEHVGNYTDKRAYLSQFYAFLPEPPFEVVAISGNFCFNHMHKEDVGFSAQWISERPEDNRTAPILIMNQTYRCPIITFANSMVEKIGNNGNDVIITYGVDDCYSRSLIVPKKKIEILLLGERYKDLTK